MSEAPTYFSRESLDANLAAPEPSDGSKTAAALGGLGSAVMGLGAIWQEAQNATLKADRTTTYLRGVDELTTKLKNDPDYSTAEQRFLQEEKRQRDQALQGLPPTDRARMSVEFERIGLRGRATVREHATTRTQDAYNANLATQYDLFLRQYDAAGSDIARESARKQFFASLDEGVRTGMNTAVRAEALKKSFSATGDTARIYRGIGTDPARMVKELRDPSFYTWLDPVTRQKYIGEAEKAYDSNQTLKLANEGRVNAGGALLTGGVAADPVSRQRVFEALIGQESSNNPRAVGRKWNTGQPVAFGLGQLTLGTARLYAPKAGVKGLDALSDQELAEWLRANPEQNLAISRSYYDTLLNRYGNRIIPALAAYNAGEKPVDAWHRQATERFGANYSAEQFVSVIAGDGYAETRKHVLSIYKRLGADATAGGLSVDGGMRLGSQIEAGDKADGAERTRMWQYYAALNKANLDAALESFKAGLPVNPGDLSAMLAPHQALAAQGNVDSMIVLRRAAEAQAISGLVDEAFKSGDPEALRSLLAKEEAGWTKRPPTAFERERVEGLKKVAAAMEGAREHPLALAQQRNMVPVTPVDLGLPPSDPAFQRQLYARAAAAAQAQGMLRGSKLSLFGDQEQAALKERVGKMGDAEKLDLVQLYGRTLEGRAFDAAVQQTFGDDRYAGIAARFGSGDSELGRLILRGAELLKLKGVDAKADDLREALKATVGRDLFPAGTAMQQQAVEAALAVYAAQRGANGVLYDASDRSGLEAALTRVVGQTVKRGGQRVAVPPGLTPNEFDRGINTLTDRDLAMFGGARGINGVEVPAYTLARYGVFQQLRPRGSEYVVFLPGAGGRLDPILDENGQAMVLDARRAFDRSRKRDGEPPDIGPLNLNDQVRMMGGFPRPERPR